MLKKSLLALFVAASMLMMAESASARRWGVYGGYYYPGPAVRAYYGPAYRTYYNPGVVVAPPIYTTPAVVYPPVYAAPAVVAPAVVAPAYVPPVYVRPRPYGYFYYPGFGPRYYYY